MKVIVIGNGAAGISAVESLIENQVDTHYDIKIITNEDASIYYRPMLSDYISQSALPNRFFLHPFAWYEENKIELIHGIPVVEILKAKKQIKLQDDRFLPYDKLIIATGSYNFIPPLEGVALPEVKSLRTLKDAEFIKKMVKPSKHAVVIGGGLLGLELGWQMIKLGLKVTVIEMMERLLPRQLDAEASGLFLEKVEATGMQIITGVGTDSILGDHHVEGIRLSNGKTITCDYVFISIGIKADIALAEQAGLEVGKGITVNAQMQTSDANIYAAGDCAEYDGINYGIWPEAVLQGKTAGLNIANQKTSYETLVPFNIYHGMNMRLFSIGDVGSLGEKAYEIIRFEYDDHFEKIFFKEGIITGGILIGNISKSAKLKSALFHKLTKEAFLESLKS
ncbi:NAD(P)/FAD-dependent oxidoreductase [Fusibacter sp. 3D3]|uniref:NAD(P)/FAD-dependent oxidoreductase n=1 Tax=Fusibacter sp. 3D3 TaxID=1048380 RepID=UPI000853BD47|nr:FAD-dependent oxidoreductase [Fusibacter sp. 3D3]GAU77104.1 nitrite reductase NAD(P)H large subunit [Fusibacter sp. 3D3]